MSRCFPYPPPGFEPPVDLLNKEKHKEKKHKKDKKDKKEKEKREGKDGKEKHRDKDRKDKKEKKEKHKHKKKDKEKEREKDKEKSKEKDNKTRSTDQAPVDSRFIDELVKRVGDGSQAGPTTQFTEKRDKKPVTVPNPVPNSVQKTNNGLARVGPTGQKVNHHLADLSERREKKSVPVPVPNSVSQRKNDELARQGPTNQMNNHRATTSFAERRVGQVSQEEGANAKRPSTSAPNPNSKNPNFTNPNSSLQRKSNGPAAQANSNNNNQQSTTLTERKGISSEMKKPVPVLPNSSQAKINGTTSQKFATNHSVPQIERKIEGPASKTGVNNHLIPQIERKIEGPTRQIGLNNHSVPQIERKIEGPSKTGVSNHSVPQIERKIEGPTKQTGMNNHSVPQIERKTEGLNPTRQTGVNNNLTGERKDNEGKKEKRKERSEEKQREKDLRREEKRRRKEREKEEKKCRKEEREREKEKEREREKEKERERVKEASLSGVSNNKACLEGPQRNIEKLGRVLGEVSNKRKEAESNGFLHEDEMRAQKLLKTEQPQKRKDEFTNGFVHENDAGPTKLNKKLPIYPPPQNGRTTNSLHTPSPIKPTLHAQTLNPNTPPNFKPTKNNFHTQINNNNNNATKLEGQPIINKAPQLSNGTVSDAKGDIVNSKKAREESKKESKESKHSKKEAKESKPHRDLKYLHVVYSVPKLKEGDLLPQDDEQDWLFGTKRNPNPNPNSTRVVESSQVWDRAVRLDSVDSIALPYVIPF